MPTPEQSTDRNRITYLHLPRNEWLICSVHNVGSPANRNQHHPKQVITRKTAQQYHSRISKRLPARCHTSHIQRTRKRVKYNHNQRCSSQNRKSSKTTVKSPQQHLAWHTIWAASHSAALLTVWGFTLALTPTQLGDSRRKHIVPNIVAVAHTATSNHRCIAVCHHPTG